MVEIEIDNPDPAGRNYLTWAPTGVRIRLLDPPGSGSDPVPVTLANRDPAVGGQLEFADQRDLPRTPKLELELPADGSPVQLWVAGVFGRPSGADGDSVLTVTRPDGEVLGTKNVMVRIRKDATKLSLDERDRFTTAMALLNDRGQGPFRAFRDMHREELALNQAHGASGFLAWHRAYLLDLERELQLIDPGVALPYWRFDRPAPDVFVPEFLGRTHVADPTLDDGGATVVFGPTNLLREWRTDEGPGVNRSARFARDAEAPVFFDQDRTLAMGGPEAIFDNGRNTDLSVPAPTLEIGFDEMELVPHGSAHTSFFGVIRDAALAPRDPLFFLLHCNVDRLWALWQRLNDRFDGTRPETYFFQGDATSEGATRPGHNLLDTMWPWNNVRSDGNPPDPTRPANAPRTPFPSVPTATAPPREPTVGNMIDYQGLLDPQNAMNFAYDDIAYGVES